MAASHCCRRERLTAKPRTRLLVGSRVLRQDGDAPLQNRIEPGGHASQAVLPEQIIDTVATGEDGWNHWYVRRDEWRFRGL